MTSNRSLILFVRNPELGKVKTRLASDLGDRKALQIYLELLRHTRETALQVQARRNLYYSHLVDEQDEWDPNHFEKHLQRGTDLGQRMENAFRETLHDSDKAVIIGSDCASLRPGIIEHAFSILDTHDFAIGPAKDGGYYLLGMKRPSPALFRDMPWSSEQVCRITIERIRELGGTYAQLPTLSDIDHAEDWARYGWPIRSTNQEL